jgi:DNA invertase Pin-like site-specific DNA recombinase
MKGGNSTLKITKIEALTPAAPKRQRTAAYARVSSAKDAQLQSLSAQISYYSKLIQSRPDWEYVGVYADDITGTKENREEFQRLLSDCRAGKIDTVITKSISRFARNTVTLLEEVRELKSIGVDVYFERENIHSMSGDGELMLSVLASFAQEESLSVSENCKWRIRKRFEDGEVVNFNKMYGYDIVKGEIAVNEEQATILRRIFAEYIGGDGVTAITKRLNAEGVPAFAGGKWNTSVVGELLKNEKLTGNCLLQKTLSTDHLTKKQIRNTGILPMYYAEGTHDAIIDMATFQEAQRIRAERAKRVKAQDTSGIRYPFSGKIVCGCCGKKYKRKLANGKQYWHCSTFNQFGKEFCATSKQIPEEVLTALSEELGGMDGIAEIFVPEPNRLVFQLSDGTTAEREWRDRSRRESWTPEMKEAARQKRLEQEAMKRNG